MPRILTVDVLVLGAGLAGLRAAWSALETAPGSRVLVASLKKGPSGSSFANVNDALGIQVPETDRAQEEFRREVLDLAAPGYVNPDLVDILAEEAAERFVDLTSLSPDFELDDLGERACHAGCFSGAPRAYIFRNLGKLFLNYRGMLESMGCTFLPGLEVRGLVTDLNPKRPRMLGAVLMGQDRNPCLIRAGAVVMALGGPAPLFARSMAGAANTGVSYGLMAETGARLANQSFLQFMWAPMPSRQQLSPATLLAPGNRIIDEDGRALLVDSDLPAELAESLETLRLERRAHCPASHARPDAALDLWLLSRRDARGLVRIRTPQGRELDVTPLAHAGNGGAIIDPWGKTTVRGLYAAGECATGMHGANRMGGAMILATQVFGARAGASAARLAMDRPPRDQAMLDMTAPLLAGWCDRRPETGILDHLRRSMQCEATLAPGPDLPGLDACLEELGRSARDRDAQLYALSAGQVTQHLLSMQEASLSIMAQRAQARVLPLRPLDRAPDRMPERSPQHAPHPVQTEASLRVRSHLQGMTLRPTA